MKHIIGKRNGKTIVSGGGSLEEQKNNLKYWEVLDSIGDDSPKANFAITDPVYYIDKDDIYTVITGDYFKTVSPSTDTSNLPFVDTNTSMLAGNVDGDNFRIYRGIQVLRNDFPEGVKLTARVYIGVPDHDDSYKNLLDYQKDTSPNLILSRTELFSNKYSFLVHDLGPDFNIGALNTEATLTTSDQFTESSGGYSISTECYDSHYTPFGRETFYITETNPNAICNGEGYYYNYTVTILPRVIIKEVYTSKNLIIR